ncbi:MAG: 5-oxoprolinase [Bacteroidetes bacterium]|nr:MAG: 5-oxoprolinase [Bacteroidota bacterium]
MKNWQIGIDTGGTFTDGIAQSPQGHLRRVKVLSNGCLRGQLLAPINATTFRLDHRWPVAHADLLAGYTAQVTGQAHPPLTVQALDLAQKTITFNQAVALRLPATLELTAHEEAPVLATRLLTQTPLAAAFPPIQLRLGTTKGTNALLERKGVRVALLITAGFEDLPYIGTQQRPHLFQLAIPEPELLHVQTIGVQERLAADGTVLQALSPAEIACIVHLIDADAIAISLLHAYRNPVHEQQLADALHAAGYRYVSASQTLSPNIKLLARTQTALVNAYLAPVIEDYLQRIQASLFGPLSGNNQFLVMSSAGSLQPAAQFHPKDSLLSGPAGGIVGAVAIARQLGFEKILTLDMGGTSTDAARYAGQFDFRFFCQVGDAQILSPSLAIETVAAGGGSICGFDGEKLTVGPASAGASPGPACYGAGGPLTITDVNLLLGKLAADAISVPLSLPAAQAALQQVQHDLLARTGTTYSDTELLRGFEQIANEKMADAIRRISVRQGFDPRDYALLAFGGAGGMHACAIAELLGINQVILPRDAGLLSAYGMGQAPLEKLAEQQVLRPLSDPALSVPELVATLFGQAQAQLRQAGPEAVAAHPARVLLYLRFRGQDTPLELRYQPGMDPTQAFLAAYAAQFGYLPEQTVIELESVKVFATTAADDPARIFPPAPQALALPGHTIRLWEELPEGFAARGPLVLAGQQATAYLPPAWQLAIWANGHAVLTHTPAATRATGESWGEAIALELFTNRFQAVAQEMGTQLQRTAFSVNVKERLDFSCALLDPQANLLVNAPHIPVHLGSLGVCARLCLEKLPLEPGDVLLVNHPKYGGSHLPDITLLQGVFLADGSCVGYVINRAHHAEIGGKRPGSMPPDATCLAEEGVVFAPQLLVRRGVPQWESVTRQLTAAPYPTRALAENLADLRAGLAALHTGEKALRALVDQYGQERVLYYMEALQKSAHQNLLQQLQPFANRPLLARESLDDGHEIVVSILFDGQQLALDFAGTSPVHPANFNANVSIVYSALIYVLRLICADDIPLNEGLLRGVRLALPPNTFLHPDFVDEPARCPAVVGGNTEVSQRLVDTLLKAFGLAAASQGTMNNFLFGNATFGYYETIGGGAGAGPGFAGRSGVHQHMTNTRITDPEDLERVYPVRLRQFALRAHSGGAGRWPGGNGLVREVEALVPLDVTLLTQRRKSGPYGQEGGEAGLPGQQLLVRADGSTEALPGVVSLNLQPGECIRIATPGGGGWGTC